MNNWNFSTHQIAGFSTLIGTPLKTNMKEMLSSDQTASILCLFHGYGSSAEDLLPLALSLAESSDFSLIAIPNAPLSLSEEQDFDVTESSSFAWWHLSEMDFLLWRMSHNDNELAKQVRQKKPEGLETARKQLLHWFSEVSQQSSSWIQVSYQPSHPLPPQKSPISQTANVKWVLGGFSQGAMMALDIALCLPIASIKGLLLFSGSLLNQTEWEKQLLQTKFPVIFQSHGQFDPIIPFSFGESLCHFLKMHHVNVQFSAFSGGHEIPSTILKQAQTYITNLFSQVG